ncbi:MAG: hypothetical protein ABI456_03805 [Ktedonobacteraceae bacterium]|nr:hypothetical protein [Chloroflexota bacterium]
MQGAGQRRPYTKEGVIASTSRERVGFQGDREGSPLHVRPRQQRINVGVLGTLFHPTR